MIDGQKRSFLKFQDVRAFLDSVLDIPRLREMAKKPLARRGWKDSSRCHDSQRLSDLRGTAGPDRAGSGRDGRASSGPAGERAGAAGPRDELRGCRPGAADRRRYDPGGAPAVRGRWGRWPGRVQLRGWRLPVDPGAAGNAEGGDTLPTREVGSWIE